MFGISRKGEIVAIDEDNIAMLKYYEERFSLYLSYEEAEEERNRRRKADLNCFGDLL